MLLKDENKTLLWGNKEIYIVLTSIRMLLKDENNTFSLKETIFVSTCIFR